jgi:predicted N-acyltransferase
MALENYRMQQVDALEAWLRPAWDALVKDSAPDAVLVSSNYLATLEDTRCVGDNTGWTPRHLLLWDEKNQLAAACPLYVKTHSYGEYVFDWAWADAYHRHNLSYYPKYLCALPFTPVSGARLLARNEAARLELAKTLVKVTQNNEMSSCHVLLPDALSALALQSAGFMQRKGVQFHWLNQQYQDFEHFLEGLTQPKRKKIRTERRKTQEAGIRFEWKDGHTATQADWAFFYRCYANTYTAHHSTPYLNEEFFKLLAQRMPNGVLLCIGMRGSQAVAASFFIRSDNRLFGRYWGTTEYIACLHFEACYYQPIQYAIENNIPVFEGGAQGEHKIARGLQPMQTTSWHWLAHPAFNNAIEQFLQRESGGMDEYLDDLNERLPFKAAQS